MASGQPTPSEPRPVREATLLQALASTDRLSDLLPLLHQHAVEAIGGRTSIVFQFDPTGEWLQATSAFGIDRLPTEPWLASGGLVPCPSALVLLLSSVALGRVGLGLTLLIAFSLGLAVVLMGIGVVVLYAKHLLPDQQKAAAHPAFRILPVVSAALIVCIGLVMTGVSLGWITPTRFIG